ncbi:remorin 1.4-like isoform X1 [Primulina tabacum]|uniref:remorin 1.4-like isoform X1 n=1 Tax=Primulina tabacum TaxID=48773 RepID=UPI003F5A42DE
MARKKGFLVALIKLFLEFEIGFLEPESTEKKEAEGSINRDAVLERVATEKRLSLIKAWEESEKSKAENKAQKKVSAIGAWENCKKANLEAELKKIENLVVIQYMNVYKNNWRKRRQSTLRK